MGRGRARAGRDGTRRGKRVGSVACQEIPFDHVTLHSSTSYRPRGYNSSSLRTLAKLACVQFM
jgi:hypothetical protein